MRLNIPAEEIVVTPGGYKTFNVDIECDPSNIVSQLSPCDITNNIDIDSLLTEIGSKNCVNHFGEELLGDFTIDDVLEYFSIEDIISHIGEDKFKDYIRDIYIDKIIDKR